VNHDQEEEEEEGRKGLGDGGREKKETKGMRQRKRERIMHDAVTSDSTMLSHHSTMQHDA